MLFECLHKTKMKLLANISPSYNIMSMWEHVRHVLCYATDRSENNLCLHDENFVPVQVCAGLKILVLVQLQE